MSSSSWLIEFRTKILCPIPTYWLDADGVLISMRIFIPSFESRDPRSPYISCSQEEGRNDRALEETVESAWRIKTSSSREQHSCALALEVRLFYSNCYFLAVIWFGGRHNSKRG